MKIRNCFLIYLFIILALTISGQEINWKDYKALNFRNIGPAGMSGRITSIDVDLSNPDRIIIGAASGGVWLSDNGGTSWKPIFDEMDCIAIGSVKINQRNTDEIWVGTGEGNPRNSLNTGRGIYKSIDGGKSFKKMGLENTKTIHRIIIHEDDPNTVYAAALGSPWGPNIERGVFRTKDGGKTWDKILYVNDQTGAADMIVDPTNPNKMFVAMWEHSRKPWFFTSGGEGSGLYMTYDGGENWTKLTSEDGLPKGDLGRIGIAISRNKPNIVYALVEAKKNGLYKSTDGGKKWKLVSEKNIGNRPFYYAELYVDPLNENRLFNIYTYVSKSEDGGKTFETIMDYGNDIHPDHHAFWIHPENNQYMIGGSDGGVTISRDGGDNWTFANNIPVGQFYHINIDNDFPYNVYGGMQDNGSWAGPSAVLKRGGIRNSDFREISFGDGFDVVPFRADSRYGYSMSQQGYVGFYDRETGYTRSVRPLHPDTVELRFNWNTGIAQDPFNDCGVYFGSQFLHYSDDCGESWNIMSPDLTTNDLEKQKSGESGGLTYDATGAENHTTILSIAPHPSDNNTILVGTDDGRLQLTTDRGQNWSDIYNRLPGAPAHGWIAQINWSNHNDKEAFVVVNNYRQNDYRPYLYHTVNSGMTWSSLVTNDLSEFNLAIVQDPEQPELLFLGADNGLFVSFNHGRKWHHMTEGFPQVQVADLKINETERDLVIGTFGRSIWILDDIQVLRDMASDVNWTQKKFGLIQPTSSYDLSYRSVDGVRFKAQGEFEGDNEYKGFARIGYWKAPKEEKQEEEEMKNKKKSKKKGKKKAKAEEEGKKSTDKDASDEKKEEVENDKKDPDKIYIAILNEAEDTIRNFSRKAIEGYNTISWSYESNGVNYPSRQDPKKDADPPRGAQVLPGTYKLIAVHGDHKDSVMVTFKSDPRRDVSTSALQAQYDAAKEMEASIEEVTTAYNRVKAAKESIKLVKTLVKGQEDTIVDQIKEHHKAFKTKIDTIEFELFGEQDVKGIKRGNPTLTGDYYTARRYIGASTGPIKGTAAIAMDKAQKRSKSFIELVDSLFDEDWDAYRELVNQVQAPIFKKLDALKE